MTEIQNNPQGQRQNTGERIQKTEDNISQNNQPKLSKLAKWSLRLGVIGLIFLLVGLFVVPFIIPKKLKDPLVIAVIIYTAPIIFGSVAFVCGVVAAIRIIVIRRYRLTGLSRAFAGIFFAWLCLSCAYGLLKPEFTVRPYAQAEVCRANLRQVWLCLEVYSNSKNGKYPTPNSWCDLLVKVILKDAEGLLKCPRDETGPCSYAMNPNCEPNSPADMVLLFESKPGWNQFGGPELINLHNHKAKGCNILFNDGSVKFIEQGEIDKLKWKIE